MQTLLKQLQVRYPTLQFAAGQQFCWSPEQQTVQYRSDASGETAVWSLLHETGHALLAHRTYQADFELIKMEVAAWERACELGTELNIKINEDHIQDCLDTYRDWLHQRSRCPKCATRCLQEADYKHYRCHNCHQVWRVSNNRFSRTYRKTLASTKPARV